MNDTPPEVAEFLRRKYMERSGAERMIMASRGFDAARTMILASLPKVLAPEELRRRLFERIYGRKLEDFIGAKNIKS
jgi:hypothetical protein